MITSMLMRSPSWRQSMASKNSSRKSSARTSSQLTRNSRTSTPNTSSSSWFLSTRPKHSSGSWTSEKNASRLLTPIISSTWSWWTTTRWWKSTKANSGKSSTRVTSTRWSLEILKTRKRRTITSQRRRTIRRWCWLVQWKSAMQRSPNTGWRNRLKPISTLLRTTRMSRCKESSTWCKSSSRLWRRLSSWTWPRWRWTFLSTERLSLQFNTLITIAKVLGREKNCLHFRSLILDQMI